MHAKQLRADTLRHVTFFDTVCSRFRITRPSGGICHHELCVNFRCHDEIYSNLLVLLANATGVLSKIIVQYLTHCSCFCCLTQDTIWVYYSPCGISKRITLVHLTKNQRGKSRNQITCIFKLNSHQRSSSCNKLQSCRVQREYLIMEPIIFVD